MYVSAKSYTRVIIDRWIPISLVSVEYWVKYTMTQLPEILGIQSLITRHVKGVMTSYKVSECTPFSQTFASANDAVTPSRKAIS